MSVQKVFRRRWAETLFLAIVICGAWFLRSKDLEQFKITDETKWGFRSANFTLALHRGEYDHTFQRSHPGTTTMWVGSIGMSFSIPDYVDRTGRYVNNGSYRTDLQQAGLEVMQIIVPGRQVIIAISMILLLICYFYLRSLVGSLGALVGTVLIAYDPFFIAHTQILHVDGLLSGFMYLGVVAFLEFLHRRKLRDLIVSAVAAGLTWLTKTPGIFLAAGIVLFAFLEWARGIHVRDWRNFWGSGLKAVWPVLIWGVVGAVIFILLWPAMWVQPLEVLKQLASESLDYAVQGHNSPVFFNGTIYPDGIIPRSLWYYYPLSYLWRTSPIVVLGLLLASLAYLFKLKPFDHPQRRHFFVSIALFSVGFMIFMNFGSKRFDRYILPVVPVLTIVAGLGWVALMRWVNSMSHPQKWTKLSAVIVAIPLLIQVSLALIYAPYYLSYFNPLMGGPRKAPEVLQIGWGEGLDEAARYLNAMPGADQMTVASWYERIFFDYFEGRTIEIETQPRISKDKIQEILAADYIVIYYHQLQRGMPENLLEVIEDQEPIHRIWINGLEYIRIYDPDSFSNPLN